MSMGCWMIIFLIGPRCSGKTTVGRALAERLNFSFIDTDEVVCAAAGSFIPEIVKEEGWEGFRERESKALAQTARAETVVATGGGVILSSENRDFLRATGMVIYLQAPADILRVRLRKLPEHSYYPSLTGKNPELEMEEILNQRAPIYEACADMFVDASREPETVVADIMDQISRNYTFSNRKRRVSA